MYAQPEVDLRFYGDDNLGNSVHGSASSINCSIHDEGRMRRKLQYFFMNPCQKYDSKRRIPFKLVLQVVKIAFVTIQLVLFGMASEKYTAFVEKNLITFKHLYLKDWDTTLETMPYPPTRGPYSVYTYDKMYDTVDFLLQRYNRTLTLALGSYDFPSNPRPYVVMCRRFYILGEIYAGNQSYNFRDLILHKCDNVTPVVINGKETYNFSAFINEKNITLNFDSINTISFHFSLKSVNLRSIDLDQEPDCYEFSITVLFDNIYHNGEVRISLDADMKSLEPCRGKIVHPSLWGFTIRVLITAFDVLVSVICALSLSMCIRSLNNAAHIRAQTIKFFKTYHAHTLCKEDRGAFIDGWLIVIIISDVLVIVGSIIKLLTDNSITSDFVTGGGALGIGVCLVWFGILRYLGFFGKYNILLRVLSVAMPSVLRFCVCAAVLFCGFMLCGWVVIGPYHVKFKTIESTAACLFSLLNGDDMYVTFSGVKKKRSLFTYYFNYIYLLLFISLFIYAVLNVFVTIIIDAYEVVKEGKNAERKTYMWNFIGKNKKRASRLYLRDEQEESGCNLGRICSNFFHKICCHKICCCCPHAYLHENGEDDDDDDDCNDSNGSTSPISLPGSSGVHGGLVNERTPLLNRLDSSDGPRERDSK